jgi:hypothetical protein
MRTPRPLNFSRSSIPTYRTPSESHFGTHPFLIPEKIPSFFSNTYGNPFCNPLSFQMNAGMGGGSPLHSQTFSLSSAESLPSHDATFASRTVLRDEEPAPARHEERSVTSLDATLMELPVSVANKRLTEKLTPLDATLTKNPGGGGHIEKLYWLPREARRGLHHPSSQYTEIGPRWWKEERYRRRMRARRRTARFVTGAVDSEGDAGDNSLSAQTWVGAPITEEGE